MYLRRFAVILGALTWTSPLITPTTSSEMSDIYLKTPELIRKNGYPVESHQVETEDGYILTIHRISSSPKSRAAPHKPVAFLQHGAFATSADWILLGPNSSLGYILADKGYDVWMGNTRGNTFSRRHRTMSTTDDKFWDFSFHEFGMYDLPASIDYVLKATNQNQLYYVGDSLGNTDFFVLTSERPEYNDKIKVMAGAAPFVLLHENSGTFVAATPTLVLGQVLNDLGVKVLAPFEWPQILIAQTLCSNKLTRILCALAVYAFAGYDPGELNEDLLPVITSHLSGGISVKLYTHISQNLKAGKFQKFDYGSQNIARYNKDTPPEYNLSAISAPVALYYGEGDTVVIPKEVIRLSRNLGNSVLAYPIPRKTFSHFGFVYGKDVKPLVNDKIVDLFKNY